MENVQLSNNPSQLDMHFNGEPHHLFGELNKKNITNDNSDGHLDSGYVTNWSISHNHTATSSISTSGLGSPRSSFASASTSGSFKKSFDLEPIAESYEVQFNDVPHFGIDVETPTTRSIRQLDAFHINTPQNDRNQSETTPKKASDFCGSRSGRKITRQNRSFWSPYESPSSKRNANEKMKSPSMKRHVLFDANDENSFDASGYDQSIYFSPIKSPNTSNILVQPINSSRAIQRHPSGIESSTPKFTFRRMHTQSTVKPILNADQTAQNRLLRKTKSFNPTQRDDVFVLRDISSQNRQDASDSNKISMIGNDDQSKYNPAKKMLAFSTQQFEHLIQSQSGEIATGITGPTGGNGEQKSSLNDIINSSPRKIANHRNQSRLIKEYSKKRSFRSAAPWSRKSVADNSYENDILMASISNDNSLDKIIAGDKSLNSGFVCDKNLKENSIDTPTRNDSISHSIREEANRTPTKKLVRSTSYNPIIATKSSPEKEKFKILYSDLPCTPPKNYQRRPLKRQASSLADTTREISAEPSAKRKLSLERTIFYDGIENLDILTRLATNFSLSEITEKILSPLNGRDLQIAYCVSKSWSLAVDSCSKARKKRLEYVQESQSIKENLFETLNEVRHSIIENNNDTDIEKVKPFHLHNIRQESIVIEAPISPPSKRFRERQKVVRTLKPNQRLINCTVCTGYCIVYGKKSSSTPEKSRARRKLMRSQTYDLFNESKVSDVPKGEYAICQSCGFNFCPTCGRESHENTKCVGPVVGPASSDEEVSPIKKVQPKSKRNLKRLARLDF